MQEGPFTVLRRTHALGVESRSKLNSRQLKAEFWCRYSPLGDVQAKWCESSTRAGVSLVRKVRYQGRCRYDGHDIFRFHCSAAPLSGLRAASVRGAYFSKIKDRVVLRKERFHGSSGGRAVVVRHSAE